MSTLQQHRKKFVSLLSKVDYSRNLQEVFADFCALGCYSLALPFYRELAGKQLQPVFNRYDETQLKLLDEAFTVMVNALEETNEDFLGDIFQEIGLSNDRLGQFFTPFPISEMLAKMSAGDIKEQLKEKHWLGVNDPACGSGGMLIAFRKVMIEQGCNPSRDAFFVGQDVSDIAFKMCYIQLSLYGVGGKVVHGNTLSMEIWTELHTPIWFLTDWPVRWALRDMMDMMRGDKKDTETSEPSIMPAPVTDAVSMKGTPGEQLSFF